jgi:hypothetical protein
LLNGEGLKSSSFGRQIKMNSLLGTLATLLQPQNITNSTMTSA